MWIKNTDNPENRKILNIEDNGNFLIISKENNTYQKKCVLFDDRELYTLTDNIIFDDDYNLRSVTDALKEKNFVKFLEAYIILNYLKNSMVQQAGINLKKEDGIRHLESLNIHREAYLINI